METLATIAQILTGIGTLLISIFLLVHEYRGRRVSTHEQMIRAYDSLNALGLTSEENLRALAAVLYPDKKDTLDALRQRLFSYITLNAIELTFVARSQRGIDGKMADLIVRDLLRSVLRNPEACDILKKGTYDPKFISVAEQVKLELREAEAQHNGRQKLDTGKTEVKVL